MRNYNGGIELTNKTGSDSVSIDLNSGHIRLASSVTNGTIVCRGVGKLTDNSAGATVNNELLYTPYIADAVLDEALSGHTSAGTLGEAVSFLRQVKAGRWKVDTGTNKLTLYDSDNTTPIATFNLRDADGMPASTSVFERVPA
jgi:hypothetical protein